MSPAPPQPEQIAEALARAERVNAAVQKAYPSIKTQRRIFEHPSEHPKLPHVWDVTYRWTIVGATVRETEVSASFSLTATCNDAAYVCHEMHRRGLILKAEEIEARFDELVAFVLASIAKHDDLRLDLARRRLTAAGLSDMIPLINELGWHRDRSQKDTDASDQLRDKYEENRDWEKAVATYLRMAADKVDKGMGVMYATLDEPSKTSPMLHFRVGLSYPWGG